MKVDYKFVGGANIIRDGGSYSCVLKGTDNKQYELVFPILPDEEARANVGNPLSYMHPKIYLGWSNDDMFVRSLSWEEAAKILLSVSPKGQSDRFIQMQNIAKANGR